MASLITSPWHRWVQFCVLPGVNYFDLFTLCVVDAVLGPTGASIPESDNQGVARTVF